MKICPSCNEEKEQTDFYKSKSNPHGYRYHCKTCDKRRANKWNKENVEKIKNKEDGDYHRKRTCQRHGITLEIFKNLLKQPGNKCPVCLCNMPWESAKHITIDHDHSCCDGPYSCGKCVRGLLCQMCNKGIGQLGENPATLQRALNYLTR